MKKAFMMGVFVVFLATVVCAEDIQYYAANLKIEEGNLMADGLTITNGPQRGYSKEGEYELVLYSSKGEVLFSMNFDLDTTVSYSPPTYCFHENGTQIEGCIEALRALEGTPDEPEVASKVVFVPYYRDASEIRVYKEKTLELSTPVFSIDRCNKDGVCDSFESTRTCPMDCPSDMDILKKRFLGIEPVYEEAGEHDPILNMELLMIIMTVLFVLGIIAATFRSKKRWV